MQQYQTGPSGYAGSGSGLASIRAGGEAGAPAGATLGGGGGGSGGGGSGGGGGGGGGEVSTPPPAGRHGLSIIPCSLLSWHCPHLFF